eukprot:CAMPEP_0178396026 /NCGR_PEP_ID=MMETSP0689_2-20121128/13521_1 /TAXON_ID=160604 /ORGANISM="Amphidinium massartii, Strain CS-259" /LENGTH=40 /DNA_ID= /DNA_START= /DNA_END= /DNA_ORIENTATION=
MADEEFESSSDTSGAHIVNSCAHSKSSSTIVLQLHVLMVR